MKHQKKFNYSFANIGNMDETPMTFGMPSNTTVDKSGTKTIFVKTTVTKKQDSLLVYLVQQVAIN